MIGALLDLILGPLGAVLAGLVAIGSAWLAGKREGRQGGETKALKDGAKREDAGREAVAREKGATDGASDRDLVDRLRGRDGDWGGV